MSSSHSHERSYVIGLLLATIVAILEGIVTYMMETKCRDVSPSKFMFLGGITSVLLSLSIPLVGVPSSVQEWPDLTYKQWNLWTTVAVISLVDAALMAFARLQSGDDQSCVSIARTSAIAGSVFLIGLFGGEMPAHFHNQMISAVLVTMCVMGVIASSMRGYFAPNTSGSLYEAV